MALSRFFPILGLCAVAAAVSSRALADDLLVELPAASEGWTTKEGSEGIILQKKFAPGRAGERGGAALIEVLRPQPVSGSLADRFARLAAVAPELAKVSPLWKRTGVTINGDDMTVQDLCCSRRGDVSLSAMMVGIQGRGRQAVAMLVNINLDSDQGRQTEGVLQDIVRSWRLAPDDKVFGLPPTDQGGLEGAYTTFKSGLRPNGFGGLSMYADNEVLVFDKSGLFSRQLPIGGRDLAGHCKDHILDCGRYRLLGGGLLSAPDRIEMLSVSNRYGMFHRSEVPLSQTAGGLKIDGTVYRALPAFKPGTRLAGTWRYTYAAAGTTAFSSGAVSVERQLTLREDGSFARTGFGGASVSNETGDTHTGFTSGKTQPVTGGRYELGGNTLILKSEAGQSESLAIFEPQDGSDSVLTINGDNYLKK